MFMKNMLRKLSSVRESYTNTALFIGVGGDGVAVYTRSKSDGAWQLRDENADTSSAAPCVMILPPGTAALRRSPIPQDTIKEAKAILDAETERTLIRNPELGGDEARVISLNRGFYGITAWIPSEQLYQSFELCKDRGFLPKAVLLPEFNLASTPPLLLICCMHRTVNIYFISNCTPLSWQSLPRGGPSIKSGIRAVLDEAHELGGPQPQHVLIWESDGLPSPAEGIRLAEESETAARKLLPGKKIIREKGTDGLLARVKIPRSGFISQDKTAFRSSINKWLSTPLSGREAARLLIPVSCAIISCLILFMAVVNLYKNEAAVLEKEASQLKIMAARSDAATKHIRTLGERRRDILRYTTGKPFVLNMFKQLNAAVPNEVKISNLKLGRSGEISVSGEAFNEVSLISFMTNLNTAEDFNKAELTTMSRQRRNKSVKFVVAFEYTPWKIFFRQESEAEQ